MSAKTPYPIWGSETKTFVNAPTILLFWIIGDPLIPQIIPPVLFNKFSSVIFICILLLLELFSESIDVISTLYSCVSLLFTVDNIVASPSSISSLNAISRPAEYLLFVIMFSF